MTLTTTLQTAHISNVIDDDYESDDAAPARGIFNGLIASCVFWAMCFAIWHLVF